MMIAAIIALVACLAASTAGLIYFAKRALDLSQAQGAAEVTAAKREGELHLADRKVDEANDAAVDADAARKKAEERGDALEGELANDATAVDADTAVDRMRGREVEVDVDVGDSRQ